MARAPQSWTQVALMSLLFVALLGGGALVFDKRVRDDSRDRTRDVLPLVARLAMERVDDLVERARGEVAHVTQLLGQLEELEHKSDAVHAALAGFFSRSVAIDLVAVVDVKGRLLELAGPETRDAQGRNLAEPGHDLLGQPIANWPLAAALCTEAPAGRAARTRLAWGLSGLRAQAFTGSLPIPAGAREPKDARNYDLRISRQLGTLERGARATVIGFMNWDRVQGIITEINSGIGQTQKISSGYIFLLQALENDYQIIAHKVTRIYGTRVVADHGLEVYAQDLRERKPISDYEFPADVEKTSAMAYSRQEGLGWVLGAGINFEDIYATSDELRQWTVSFVTLVVGLAVLASLLFLRSRRQFRISVDQIVQSAEGMARGSFPEQVVVEDQKDLGRIATAFTRMATSLERRHELTQAKGRAFREIRPNPYIVGNPIRDPKMFFGRKRALAYARERLEAEGVGVALVFCGDRRSGKTSILCQLQGGSLGEDFRPVMVDLQALAASASEADFYEGLFFEIQEGVKEAESLEMSSELSPAQGFRQALDRLQDRLAGRRLVLLLDEYETLDELLLSGRVPESTVTILASLLEGYPPVSLVLSGSRPLSEARGDVWTPLINRALYRKVGFLHREEAEALVTRPLEGLVEFEFGVVDRVLALTAGHPYYTQIICQNLVDHLNRARRNVADLHDLASVTAEVLADPPPQMTYFWNRELEDRERLFLALLAEEIPEEGGMASPLRLLHGARERKLPLELTADLLDQMIRHFESVRFLKLGGGDVGFEMDLFRLHVREAHPVYQMTGGEADRP
jgi:hypothetical protein